MYLNTEKSALKGLVKIPGSKSHTIRAVAIASLARGKSVIREPLVSSDTLSAVSAYSCLGAVIDISDQRAWKVTGTGGEIKPADTVIDVGNSGTTLRLAAGSAALATTSNAVTFTGDDQIRSRPVQPLIDSLNELGADISTVNENGCAPVNVRGTIRGGSTSIEGFTSQYLSSLLLACPLAENDSEITVTSLNERDYVQITLDWLDKLGIKYENDSMNYFKIPGGQVYRSFDETIPADFSSATFFLTAGAITDSDLTITGLDFSDSQPDKAVADYLKAMNANISIENNDVHIKGSTLKAAEIDMNRTPDALCAMAAAAMFAEGKTILANVPQARKKETDRIAVMCRELTKFGARVEEKPDGLIIHGGSELRGCKVEGHHDHRVVMALAIAGLAIKGTTRISGAEAVNVTFPDFVKLMSGIGAKMETNN